MCLVAECVYLPNYEYNLIQNDAEVIDKRIYLA